MRRGGPDTATRGTVRDIKTTKTLLEVKQLTYHLQNVHKWSAAKSFRVWQAREPGCPTGHNNCAVQVDVEAM